MLHRLVVKVVGGVIVVNPVANTCPVCLDAPNAPKGGALYLLVLAAYMLRT